MPGTVLVAAHPEINRSWQHREGNHQQKSHGVKILQQVKVQCVNSEECKAVIVPYPGTLGQQSTALRLHLIEGKPFLEAAEGQASHGTQLPVLLVIN